MRSWRSFLGLLVILAATWMAYRPGLSGPFLFDDFANLPALGASGPITDWAILERYVTSGIADPTGRPVAMLSFLIDARDWPADPYPFKRSNVILHLLNGVLLYFLLVRLGSSVPGRVPPSRDGRHLAALLAAAAWMLHPLFVSTTLYIVQREAMLPATFILLGLLGWIRGRDLLAQGDGKRGMLLASLSLGIGTMLGVLSKANGILLPAFVLVIEFALLRRTQAIRESGALRTHNILLWACGIVSAAVPIGLLYLGANGLIHGIGTQRPWTLGQRLLTEPRVLWDYLRLLWFPHPYTAGVFNDQFVPSTSLLHPWTTLPALAGVVTLIALAVKFRRRAPVASIAIVFFLVGHTIESTTIPLELYFEHRNYVPAMLMFWPLALWLCDTRPSRILNAPAMVRLAFGVALIGGLAWMTHSNASLWGNGQEQARLWAALNPESPRAQVNVAQNDIAEGHPAAAIGRLAPLLREHPEEVQLALNMVAARCAMRSLDAKDIEGARLALSTARDPGTLLVSWFGRAIAAARNKTCPALDLATISSLADAGAANPNFPPGRRQDLSHIQGLISLERGDATHALAAFDQALVLDPRPDIALEQAATLGSAGYAAEGLRHLATFDKLAVSNRPSPGMPMLHAWVLERQQYWPIERVRLENTLQNDLRQGSTPP